MRRGGTGWGPSAVSFTLVVRVYVVGLNVVGEIGVMWVGTYVFGHLAYIASFDFGSKLYVINWW